jgi:hypothetical protein
VTRACGKDGRQSSEANAVWKTRRKNGRPRLRWLNEVEVDLRETGMRRWRTKAVYSNEWQKILNEAYVLGLQCQGVSVKL